MNHTVNLVDKERLRKAPRCPDYDKDCAEVKNHYLCWIAGAKLEVLQDYCPFVIGMYPREQ